MSFGASARYRIEFVFVTGGHPRMLIHIHHRVRVSDR